MNIQYRVLHRRNRKKKKALIDTLCTLYSISTKYRDDIDITTNKLSYVGFITEISRRSKVIYLYLLFNTSVLQPYHFFFNYSVFKPF